MDELMKESESTQLIELCGGNESAAGDLQTLCDCVVNSANYSLCSQDKYKKLKIKALLKATKKIEARKIASSQQKALQQKRTKAHNQRWARLARARAQKHRERKSRPRPTSRVVDERARKQRQSARTQGRRQMRRKLLSFGGCCECTESQSRPNCNDECDASICSFDPCCCSNQWDSICANAKHVVVTSNLILPEVTCFLIICGQIGNSALVPRNFFGEIEQI